ncbi:DUF881 domain-containing protein [Actinoplanes sp. TRM 88003]|uniref:DUF881 domain-containing protein n=1 Tax=Paractinoplanes aksuensis TaxID=2939490 RepID=A0ABT1DFE8_9ACTN|nr:DUF881 domain-containing protein [Actinoplanes aksuensis]MCO8269547.1 DUF881 domain-containing protein [Actinoplanes aksuensis]
MTDKSEPRPEYDAEPGMPTAGRPPVPVENEADEVTQLLSGEGPTVETPRKALLEPKTVDLDGPTRRLSVPSPEPVTEAPEPVDDTERVKAAAGDDVAAAAPPPAERPEVVQNKPGFFSTLKKRPSSSPAGLLILALLALFGFTLVVQLRSNDGGDGLATARQEDLVRILSELEARDSRLQSEISALETSQRQLTSGVAGRQAALAEAEKRADELGLLAGTVPGRGPGLRIVIDGVKASAILNTVQELRGAGGEVMQIAGAEGKAVRIVASSYFVDAEGGGVIVDGDRMTGPYTLTVIGVPQVMQTALQIPGGVVASVNSGGGSVTLEQRTLVEVTAVRDATTLQYARPAS